MHYSELQAQGSHVHEINDTGSNLGCRSMRARLLSSYGLSVPRDTVLRLQHTLDPEGVDMRSSHRLTRRLYRNSGPNFLIHIDGYDKLKPYGFAIHGAICGYSRKVVWLNVSDTNNNPYVVASYFVNFIDTVQGVPRCIRMDAGTENTCIEDIQKAFRWMHEDDMAADKSVIIAASKSNQRIERWWRSMKESGVGCWIDLFKDLQTGNALNFTNHLERQCLRYCCMDVIQRDLDRIKDEWNCHQPRHRQNEPFSNGRPDLMYCMPHLFGAVDYILPVKKCDIDDIRAQTTSPNPKGVTPAFKQMCDHLVDSNGKRQPNNSHEALILFEWLLDTLRGI